MTSDMPWVLVRVAHGLFALSSHHVQEMVSTPPVTRAPHLPEFVRGLINLRGQVMPLVDLRQRFGLESQTRATADLIALLEAREQDHHRWLDELRASVRDKKPFTLTTDPHSCAFGVWYDAFRTDNLMLETVLKRFDKPHARIHQIGAQVVEMMARQQCAECDAILDEASGTTLKALVDLFAEARTILRESSREIAVVVRGAGPACAVAVDGIESVERLSEETDTVLDERVVGVRSECVDTIARRPRDGSLVLTLHAGRLLIPAAA